MAAAGDRSIGRVDRRGPVRSGSATAPAGSSATRRRTAAATAVPAAAGSPGRARAGLDSVAIPRRYRGVSFDRPPVTDIARDAADVVQDVRRFVRNIDAATSTQGRGLWLMGDTGTGKTTLAMLVSKAALEAGTLGRDLLAAAAARPRSADLSTATRTGSYVDFFERLDRGRPAAHRRPRRREHDRLGARAALLDRQRALRGRALDHRHDQPRRDAELDEQIGERTVSRLVEICGDPLPLFGEDRSASESAIGAEDVTAQPRSACAGQRPYTQLSCRDSCIVGAQWGDEGKGKVIDLLAEQADARRPLPGRQQRRPHDRARRRGVQAPPDPLRDPPPGQDVRDRQRRRGRPGC